MDKMNTNAHVKLPVVKETFEELKCTLDTRRCDYLLFVMDNIDERAMFAVSRNVNEYIGFREMDQLYLKFVSFCDQYNIKFNTPLRYEADERNNVHNHIPVESANFNELMLATGLNDVDDDDTVDEHEENKDADPLMNYSDNEDGNGSENEHDRLQDSDEEEEEDETDEEEEENVKSTGNNTVDMFFTNTFIENKETNDQDNQFIAHQNKNDDTSISPKARKTGSVKKGLPKSPKSTTTTNEGNSVEKPTGSSGTKEYSCIECDATFTDRSAFVMHARSHDQDSNTNTKMYQCHMCERQLPTKKSLDIHITSHSTAKSFVCDICGKALKYKQTLRVHMLSHDQSTCGHGCDVCGKRFVQKYDLYKHLPIHEEIKPYICEICGRGFSQKSVLLQHQLTHSDERNFACEVCQKMFKQAKDMKKHYVRCHLDPDDVNTTGITVFRCSFCNKLFHDSQKLKRHERTHTGERPYVCDVCNKAFGARQNLNSHLKIHTGERPYKCDICGKGFIHPRGLRQHRQSHEQSASYDLNPDHVMI